MAQRAHRPNAASRWVASTCGREVDIPEILQIKRWGVTARFGDVVLKASYTPLFPQVTDVHALLERIVPEGAPRLIASQMVDGQLWTLFEHISRGRCRGGGNAWIPRGYGT